MRLNEILLIQGPPGTGKTQTIAGIVAMLLFDAGEDQKIKIQVCAPSNTAVDEILNRIRTRGLLGMSTDENFLKELIIRVGAPDYEATPEILPFTLEEKTK
jgi:ATP-dependent exoDNAse (exonuclease V) alpha subunit